MPTIIPDVASAPAAHAASHADGSSDELNTVGSPLNVKNVVSTGAGSTIKVESGGASAAAPQLAHDGDTGTGTRFQTAVQSFTVAGVARQAISAAGVAAIGAFLGLVGNGASRGFKFGGDSNTGVESPGADEANLIAGNQVCFTWKETASAALISFFGGTPVAKIDIVGARDVPEEALADLIAKLETTNILSDSTTAS